MSEVQQTRRQEALYEHELHASPLGRVPPPVRSLIWQYAVSSLEDLEALRRTCHLLRAEAADVVGYVQLNFLMGRSTDNGDRSAAGDAREQEARMDSSSTWERVERAVKALPKLRTLSVRNSSIRDSVLIRLVDRAGAASHHESSPVQHLLLSRCMGVSMSAIFRAIPRWTRLQTLCLSNVSNVALPWDPSLRLPELRHLALTNCTVQFRQTAGDVHTSLPAWLLTCPNLELLCIGGLLCDEMPRFLPRGAALGRDTALAAAAGYAPISEWEDVAWAHGVREHLGLTARSFPLAAVEVTGVRSVDGLCQEMVHQCIDSWRVLVDELREARAMRPAHRVVSLDFTRDSILDDIAEAGFAARSLPTVASRLPEMSSSSDASVVMRCRSPPGWQLALEAATMAVADSFRRTALHTTCVRGNATLTEALLRLGADPDVRGTRGNTPLCLAAEFGHASCAALLLGLPLEQADPYGPLLPGASSESQYGERIGDTEPQASNASATDSEAARGGGAEEGEEKGGAGVVEDESVAGVDVAAAERHVRKGVWVRNNRMESPALIAALRGHQTVLRLVLRKECSFPIQERQWLRQRVRSVADGWTPLHAAALDRAILSAQDLAEAGYSVNATNRHGQTPLHVAARQGDAGLCRFLCENGASRSIRDVAQERPVDVAQSKGHLQLLELLRDAEDDDPLGEAAAAKRQKRQRRRQMQRRHQ